MGRWRAALAAVLGLGLVLAGGMSGAMGQAPLGDDVTVTCRGEGSKVLLPEGICTLFIDRLRAARPQARIDEGVDGDVTLVVMALGDGQITARIDQGSRRGKPLAMARRGAPLDAGAYTQFFDGLIKATFPS